MHIRNEKTKTKTKNKLQGACNADRHVSIKRIFFVKNFNIIIFNITLHISLHFCKKTSILFFGVKNIICSEIYFSFKQYILYSIVHIFIIIKLHNGAFDRVRNFYDHAHARDVGPCLELLLFLIGNVFREIRVPKD